MAKSGVANVAMSGGPHTANLRIRLDYEPPNAQLRELLVPFQDETAREIISVALKMLEIKEDERYKNLGLFKGTELLADTLPLQSQCEESEEGFEGHFLLQRQASFARCVCGHRFATDELVCPSASCGAKRPDRVGTVPEPAGYLVRHQFAVVLEQSNHGCTNFLRLATFLEKISGLYSFEIAKPARGVKELEFGDEMKEFMTAYAMTETLAVTCCSLIKSFHSAVASTIVEPMLLHHSKQTETMRNVEKQERAHRENLDKLNKLLAKEAITCDKELKALQAAVKEVKAGQLQWTPQGWVDKSQGKDKVIVKMIQKEKLARTKAVKAFAAYEALFAKAREAENALYSYIPIAIKQARQVDRERLSLSKFYMTKFSTLFSTLAGSLKTMNMDPVLASLNDDASMQGCLDMWSRVLGEPPPLERIEFKLPCTSEHLAKFEELHVGDPSELKLPLHLYPPVDTQQETFRQFGTKMAVSVAIPQDYYTPAKQMEISQKIRAMDLTCRLLDYFVVFGRGPLAASSFEGAETDFDQDLSLGSLSYEGAQLQHYPAWEWPDAPMPPNLPMFAFPLGVQLIVGIEGPALAHARRPRMFRFMCTKIDGTRQHCSALVVYDKVSPKTRIALYDAKIKKLDEAIAHHAHLLAEKEVGILTDHRTRATVEKLGAQIAEALAAGQDGAAVPLREQRNKLIESLGGKLLSRRQQKAAEEAARERLQEQREEEEAKRREEEARAEKTHEDGGMATDEKQRSSPIKSSREAVYYDDSPIVQGDVVELHGLNTESYNGQHGLVIAVYGNGRYDVILGDKEAQRFKDTNLRKLRGPYAPPLRPKRIPPMPAGPPPPGPPGGALPPGPPPPPLLPPGLAPRTSQDRSGPLSPSDTPSTPREGEDVSDEKSKASSLAFGESTKDLDLEEVVYEPKVLCLISSHPICEAMEGFLRVFHNARSSQSLTFERLVSNVIHEIPVPPRGKISVRWQPEESVEEPVVISRAPTNRLPEIDCDFRYLFRTLDHDTIIAVFTAIATEQRVIFVSESLQMLVHVSETFLSLLFPFMWQGVYIPILPEALWDFLYAPVPFVAGIHSDVLRRKDVPDDVVCVDLDKGELGPLSQPLPALEPSSARKLMAQLKKFADIKQKNRDFVKRLDDAFDLGHKVDLEMKVKKAKERKPGKDLQVPFQTPRLSKEAETPRRVNHKELAALSQLRAMVETEQRQNFDVAEIRQAFLRFWVKALMKYSAFLKPWVPQHGEEETLEACFDINKFIESSSAGARPVLSEICRTQMCWNFIAAKLDGMKKGATMPAYIRFFDECIVEKENRSSTKLVKDSTAFLHEGEHDSADFFDAPSPNMDHLGNTVRQPWPLFDPKLFLPLRYVQPLTELETKKKQLETAWYDHTLLPHTPSQSEDVALEEAIRQHGPSRSRGSVVARGQALAALFSQAISEREAIAAVTNLKETTPDTRKARRRSTVWGGERPSVDPSAAVQLKAAKAEIEELKKRIAELEAKAKLSSA